MPDFGITEFLIPLLVSGLGIGAETAAAAAPILVTAGEGALVGAGTSALTGGKPLIGALEGAVTSGVLSGLGPVVGEATGPALGVGAEDATTIADTLLGAGIGAGGKALEHKNPLTGAVTGGINGFMTGLRSSAGSSSPSAATSGGGLSAAGALGAGSAPSDLTSFVDIPGVGAAGGVPGVSGQVVPDPFTLGTVLSAAPGPVAAALGGTSASGGGTADLLAQLGRNPIGAETLTPSPIGQVEAALGLSTPSSSTPAPLSPLDRQIAAYGGTPPAAAKPDFLSRLSSDPLGTIADNGKLALAGAGLGYDALKGNKPPQGQEQLQALADSLTKQSKQLTSTALNTALPPEAQAQLEQARSSATAGIRSQFARMGLGGSTMEAQALAGVQEQIAAQGSTIMQQLMQQGMSAAQAADTMLAQIMQSNVSRDNALSSAVGSFAGALAGSK
jgi:hypothetical protein